MHVDDEYAALLNRAARWKAAAKEYRKHFRKMLQGTRMTVRFKTARLRGDVMVLRARIAELEAQIKGRGGSESARTTSAGDHPRHSAPYWNAAGLEVLIKDMARGCRGDAEKMRQYLSARLKDAYEMEAGARATLPPED